MFIVLKFLTFLLVLFTLNSCSNKEDKYVGIWKSTNDSTILLVISKSGQNYIIEYQNKMIESESVSKKYPAFHDKNNDKLQLMGNKEVEIIHDVNTDQLIFENGESFKRK